MMMTMKKKTERSAFLITAAGSSNRMGDGQKKEYRLLDGKPVLFYSIEAALSLGMFSVIAISLPPCDVKEWETRIKQEFKGYKSDFILVPGGKSRQESVKNALLSIEKFSPDFVLIHDGARPWVDSALIKRVLDKTMEKKACIPVIPSVDAVKRISKDGRVELHLSKYEYVAAQTPQGFSYTLITRAHLNAAPDTVFFDDAEMVAAMGEDVFFVEGDPRNKKITFGWDL